jgi:DNA-directed RNA polymerase specialized sigma24 family protein
MFEFNETEYKYLCEKALLNDELKTIFLYKIKGYSIIQIADKLNLSTRTVDRRIKLLKKKIKKCI